MSFAIFLSGSGWLLITALPHYFRTITGETTNLADKKPEIIRQLTQTRSTWTASLPKSHNKTEKKED